MIKEKINSIRKSKDGKVLVENFASLTLLQIAGYIFPLITLPYLARVIGVEKFGEIAFASSIVVYFQTVVDWGFSYTATRDIARCRNDIVKVSEIFCNVMGAKILLLAVSTIVFTVCVYSIPFLYERRLVLWMTFLYIPGYLMFPDWFFQAIEKMKYITILNVFSKLLFTIAIFIFIKEKSDFVLQPLFSALGFIISGFITMYYIVNKWKVKMIIPSYKNIKLSIKGSADVFLNNLMPNLYNSFSVMLLGVLGGMVANGKLNAGTKFIAVFQNFMLVISRTFFPYLSRKIDRHSLFAKMNIIIASIVSVLLFLGAPIIIKLFLTPEFYDGITVLRIMSFSILFLTLTSVYGVNYMIVQGYEKQLRRITMIVSLIGFSMAIPLIYFFSFIGAAITITLTRGLLGGSTMYFACKYKKN
jgi:PST family polysaccharide transporter